ncbi:DegT/DnrJ/EryC1/StrS family aminotransferase, partial [Candidatus Woesearchaeota archaeon]|nr:DegT/DnrJ/EryC1/StrS family aminotransferase [Candidatus Woesearchaeota archaeon]
SLKEIYNWNDSDEVIVPSVTFVATLNIILHNKMTPVIVDVDKDYYELDPSLIEEKITEKTRAIIPVHLFGQPCDMDPILEIAKKHDLKIIEDSCETMFAKYKGKFTGTFGEIGCFSTYVAHLISTGVGGINITNNPDLAVKLRSIFNHGRDAIYISIDDTKGKSESEFKEIIKKRFSFVNLGHSFRITEFEGALGLSQLDNWEEMINKRRENADYLIKNLSIFKDHIQLPAIRPDTEHSFMMFPIVLLKEEKTRVITLLEENGIETRDMLPITNQPVYRKYLDIKEEDYPVAKWINKGGFYIGCHQDLTKEDLDKIIDVFKTKIFN